MPNFSRYLRAHQVEKVKHPDGTVVAQHFSTTHRIFAQRMFTRIVLMQVFMISSNGRPNLSRSYFDHHTDKVKHPEGTVFYHIVITMDDILTQPPFGVCHAERFEHHDDIVNAQTFTHRQGIVAQFTITRNVLTYAFRFSRNWRMNRG